VVERAHIETLYRRYAPLIHSRARRLLGSDADDIVHEVFLRWLRSPPAGDATSSWFFVTTTNACLDRIRHRNRRGDAWQDAVASAIPVIDAERLLVDKDTCRRVLGVVDEKTATVAALVYIDEMTQEEVAAMLGVTRTAVAKRLTRFLREARARVPMPSAGE
jgi:RNA polymerase sigma factor (sigma-70 family)